MLYFNQHYPGSGAKRGIEAAVHENEGIVHLHSQDGEEFQLLSARHEEYGGRLVNDCWFDSNFLDCHNHLLADLRTHRLCCDACDDHKCDCRDHIEFKAGSYR